MPLPSELVYNSLDGEEVKQILCARFLDVLNQVPDFRKFITFPRVKMELNIRLEVAGRTPPNFRVLDELVVRANPSALPQLDPTQVEEQVEMEQTIEINGDDMEGGQPPDELREEHGLPTTTPTRGRGGAVEDAPTFAKTVGKYAYAAFVEMDHGPARVRTGNETVVPLKNTDNHSGPDVSLAQTEFGEAFKGLQESRKQR